MALTRVSCSHVSPGSASCCSPVRHDPQDEHGRAAYYCSRVVSRMGTCGQQTCILCEQPSTGSWQASRGGAGGKARLGCVGGWQAQELAPGQRRVPQLLLRVRWGLCVSSCLLPSLQVQRAQHNREGGEKGKGKDRNDAPRAPVSLQCPLCSCAPSRPPQDDTAIVLHMPGNMPGERHCLLIPRASRTHHHVVF